MTPLEKLDTLPPDERRAFLALFAGAKSTWRTRSDTDAMPFTGKAECEWISPWRPFWQEKLPALGFITFTEGAPFPTPGATFDSSTEVTIEVTDEGSEAREAWWNRLHAKVAAED